MNQELLDQLAQDLRRGIANLESLQIASDSYGDMRMEVGKLAWEMGQFLNAIRPRLVGDEISRSYTLHNRMNKWAYQPPSVTADDFGVAPPFDHAKPPIVRPDSFGVAGIVEKGRPYIDLCDESLYGRGYRTSLEPLKMPAGRYFLSATK